MGPDRRRLLPARGDYDEVLRIRTEDELPVYQRLGDTRSIAVTWGQIADVYHERGDFDEVLRIRTEDELPVYQRLGDTREIAGDVGQDRRRLPSSRRPQGGSGSAVLGASRPIDDLATTTASRRRNGASHNSTSPQRDLNSALPRLIESFQIFTHLQRPDGIAVVGEILGRILHQAGHDQAPTVLESAIAAHNRIGADRPRQRPHHPPQRRNEHMIIHLSGPDAAAVQAARDRIGQLAARWDTHVASVPSEDPPPKTERSSTRSP